MEIQTSFIPKKSLAASGGGGGRRPVGVLLLLSILVFVTAALVHAGAWLYESQLEGSIANKRDMLKKAEAAFDPGILEVLNRLDAKITAAQGNGQSSGLLVRHITLLPLIEYLERATLPSVRFRSFKYEYSDSAPIGLKLTGVAQNYKSVALQSDVFTASGTARPLNDIVFSDLNLDAQGGVGFNFTATVDPRLLSYREVIKQAQGL
ncbi:MAG: hypothetical protein A2542_02455 [Parcubacteria group bacterium RIFOXYD2_FULL_52_8]|nr:MAG: hypothetical protein A2542_02455 [Parcubacteria group bacterium RIFOXYD2_FULL_52_8]